MASTTSASRYQKLNGIFVPTTVIIAAITVFANQFPKVVKENFGENAKTQIAQMENPATDKTTALLLEKFVVQAERLVALEMRIANQEKKIASVEDKQDDSVKLLMEMRASIARIEGSLQKGNRNETR